MQNSQQIFKLHSEYKPTGDQPQAIEKLVKGFKEGNQFETLLGVTGSGKTFTMANVIAQLNKPTLVLAHNKTLAAQLYGEMKEFFPENAVEYFVSYYDYYQPEAYVPSTDTYIAKDASTNDEIDKLRLSATAALCERKDVIVVSSVSCIYGLGAPEEFFDMMISLRPGMEKDRDEVIKELIDIQYNRNEMDFHRGTFRVRGDVLEIFPANYSDRAIRVEFFGDEIDRITEVDVLTGEIHNELKHAAIFPASYQIDPYYQNVLSSFLQNFQVSSYTLPPAIFIYLSDSRIKIAANQTFVLRCFIISDFYRKWQPVYNIFLHIHTRIHFD